MSHRRRLKLSLAVMVMLALLDWITKPSYDLVTWKSEGAAGLFGGTATQFIIDKDLLDFQVKPEGQKKLFKISYDLEASSVKRICEKPDVVKAYGKTDWGKLNSAIKDIAVDLKFRGDYTGTSRKNIQKSIADNDLAAFKKVIKDKSKWSNVPKDRFNRRTAFLDNASESPKLTK